MRVLIYFEPPKEMDNYEGARLRKTLKGACEAADITWVDDEMGSPDIVHFLTPRDEKKLNKAKEKGFKTVISCGYCEADPMARFFAYKKGEEPHLSPASLRMLNHADMVLVPNQEIEEWAKRDGVLTPMAILEPAVNLSRFDGISPVERGVFNRYFGIRDKESYFLASGPYDSNEALDAFISIAEKRPESKFFVFFSKPKATSFVKFLPAKVERKGPKNLIFSPIVEDDVYRSALLNASGYLRYGDEFSAGVSILEAFAAKTPVVAFCNQSRSPILKNGVNCRIYEDVSEAEKALSDLSLPETKSTIMAAYKEAKDHTLSSLGKALKKVYADLLTQQNKEDI